MVYQCITDVKAIRAYLADASVIAFDFETAPLPPYRSDPKAALDAHRAHIIGVSLSVAEDSGIYIPLRHLDGGNADADSIIPFLRDAVWTNSKVTKVAHNLAFESMFLYDLGIILQPPCYNTMAAAQLTLKSRYTFRKLTDCGLKTLVPELLGVELPSFETVTGGKYFDELPSHAPETMRYACADSDFALRLYHRFNTWFAQYLPEHRSLVESVENPTAVYCGLMKYNGLLMDKPAMIQKQVECMDKLLEVRHTIRDMIGDVDIGANANTQAFKQYLFEDLKLPVLKTTAKSKEAADDQTLIMLSEWCAAHRPELVPLFELIQEYRKWSKLKTTYIDGYLKCLNSVTGRIHPDLLPLATETGRFASRNPNLQNCFDNQTEILTNRGFVHFANLHPTDRVAEWENGRIRFVTPLDKVARPYLGRMIMVENQHIDLCMTPDHRCLLQNRKTEEFKVVSAENYCEDAYQLHAGQYDFGKNSMTREEVILLAATQADGNYHDGGIDFVFSKARKYRRLIHAVHALHIPHSDSVKANGQVRIRLFKSEFTQWVMEKLGEGKTWGSWLLTYDKQSIRYILDELYEWDGCFTRKNAYSSSVKSNADWMQILYTLMNQRAHLREYHNGNPNSLINFQLDLSDRNYSLTTNIVKKQFCYQGNIYCVSVPSGFIVVRRHGQVCITGNCPRKTNDPVGIRSFIVAPEGQGAGQLRFLADRAARRRVLLP